MAGCFFLPPHPMMVSLSLISLSLSNLSTLSRHETCFFDDESSSPIQFQNWFKTSKEQVTVSVRVWGLLLSLNNILSNDGSDLLGDLDSILDLLWVGQVGLGLEFLVGGESSI